MRLRYVALLNPDRADIATLSRATEVSFVPMEAVGEQGELAVDGTRPLGDVEKGYTYFRDGDVIVAKITPCFENGKGAFAQGLANSIGFGTTELTVLRPRPGYSGRFLYYVTYGHEFRKNAEGAMRGTGGQKRVPDDFFRDYSANFPQLEDQEAIASFLNNQTADINRLIAEKERLLVLVQEYRHSFISRAVAGHTLRHDREKDSGIEWLGSVPAHWKLTKFMAIAEVVRGASPRPAGDPLFFGGTFLPWVTVAEITKDDAKTLTVCESSLTELGALHSRTIPPHTLVLTNSGVTLGVPKILEVSACANDGVLAFLNLSAEVDISYAYYYLSSLTEVFRGRLKQGAGQPNLNTSLVKATPIPLPPLAEQHRIVLDIEGEISRVDELRWHLEGHVAKLREYRSAVIHAAVTGKIDVRDFRPNPPLQ